MHVEARVLGQPRFYLGMLMGCIVVGDQMQLLVLGCVAIDLAQEAQPLLVTMFRLALANDSPIERVQRGKQCRHTMSLVIVGHRLSATSLKRQARLGPVKRLDLGLLIAAHDQGVLRGSRYSPTMSSSFSTKCLSFDTLKLSTRCGLSPCACQMRRTLAALTPATAAMLRVLQCVSLSGRCCVVSATMVLTLRAEIFRFRPGRAPSRSIPVPPSAMKRPRPR